MNPRSLQPEPAPPPSLPLPLGEGRGEGAFRRRAFTPPSLPLPLGEGRGEGALRRSAFTVTELLVAVSIIVLLMGMIASALSAARGSQRVQATQALITKLDRVVQQHYSSYASRPVPATLLTGTSTITAADRATYLRRLASAELPDTWADVRAISTGTLTAFGSGTTPRLPRTAPQNAYVGLLASSTVPPTDQFADAECLFMIVMMGGVADCLDCDALGSSQMGDTDNDGAFEFLDGWGQPIRYVLWPAKLELPPGSGNFFSSTAPFYSDPSTANTGRTMRPLIFSGGPDKTPSIITGTGNLAAGVSCGVPASISAGGRDTSSSDARADNITNFDAEARK